MIGAETTLAERTLAALVELRTERLPKLQYLEALAIAIAPQMGVKYLDEAAADKRAAACHAINSLTQMLRESATNATELDPVWDRAIAQTQAWIATAKPIE